MRVKHVPGDSAGPVDLPHTKPGFAQTLYHDEHSRGHKTPGLDTGHADGEKSSLGRSCGTHAKGEITEGAFDGLGGVATTKGETRADVCTWAQEESHGTREAAREGVPTGREHRVQGGKRGAARGRP